LFPEALGTVGKSAVSVCGSDDDYVNVGVGVVMNLASVGFFFLL